MKAKNRIKGKKQDEGKNCLNQDFQDYWMCRIKAKTRIKGKKQDEGKGERQ